MGSRLGLGVAAVTRQTPFRRVTAMGAECSAGETPSDRVGVSARASLSGSGFQGVSAEESRWEEQI